LDCLRSPEIIQTLPQHDLQSADAKDVYWHLLRSAASNRTSSAASTA
jgi:hypothetical protein